MSAWLVYWILMLDRFLVFAGVVAFLSLTALGLCVWAYIFWKDARADWSWDKNRDGSPTERFNSKKRCYSLIAKIGVIASGVIFILTIFPAIFFPGTKEACVIYLLPKVSNNEQVQQVPDKLLAIMNKKLDEWVEDVRGKK